MDIYKNFDIKVKLIIMKKSLSKDTKGKQQTIK